MILWAVLGPWPEPPSPYSLQRAQHKESTVETWPHGNSVRSSPRLVFPREGGWKSDGNVLSIQKQHLLCSHSPIPETSSVGTNQRQGDAGKCINALGLLFQGEPPTVSPWLLSTCSPNFISDVTIQLIFLSSCFM